MFELFRGKSAAEQEEIFLEDAEDLMEKSAAAVAEEGLELEPELDPSRLEDRKDPEPDEEYDDDDEEEARRSSGWGKKPTRRNQMNEFPDTVRFVDPTAVIFDLKDSKEMKAYNKLLKRASDREAPEIIITERDSQKYEGGWTMLVEYSEVEYQQI